ncbi:sigma-70 family RNA polymerase sigma factor [candidate division KSB1 bacterium]|nr:sigma-70 family RNA polymerase sigma factor [candidate division KSB1 bacterium]
MTDSDLIQKYTSGDINAFNQLVWRWEKPIFNFILKMCCDFELSKEICQKTFIRAYKSLKKLKDPAKFKSWLYQIAVNLCRDEIRRTAQQRTVSLDKLHEESNQGAILPENLMIREDGSPESCWGRKEARQLIHKALNTIPEEQRIVIIMKEYQGLKFYEIAEILNQSINTIKSRMYYGLSALRKVFEQWNIQKEAFEYEL